ncbi:MAG TPA: hypothetical protein VJM15_03940 [Sphingomicrobium sp.]|nr:hypothetical protein [Sphingomicrobium sp.]
MIAVVGASAIFLIATQASINAPRDAFKTCLKEQTSKAANEKVATDAFEAYVRTGCAAQLGAFKSAVIAFDVKNKMTRKDASDDADLMIDDFIASAVDNYEYRSSANKQAASPPAAAPAPPAVTPPTTPAAAPQPPK